MTPEQQETILTIARTALDDELRRRAGQKMDRNAPTSEPVLPESFSGVFVTLKTGSRLRGCMGTFRPLGTLAQTVDRMTRTSCCDDPRFAHDRIHPDELDSLNIEISVLGALETTDDPARLEIGKHGILIRRGEHSGCFLPQVASERGWSAERFLSECCSLKAGLPADAWKEPETKVSLFAAEIIEGPAQPGGPT